MDVRLWLTRIAASANEVLTTSRWPWESNPHLPCNSALPGNFPYAQHISQWQRPIFHLPCRMKKGTIYMDSITAGSVDRNDIDWCSQPERHDTSNVHIVASTEFETFWNDLGHVILAPIEFQDEYLDPFTRVAADLESDGVITDLVHPFSVSCTSFFDCHGYDEKVKTRLQTPSLPSTSQCVRGLYLTLITLRLNRSQDTPFASEQPDLEINCLKLRRKRPQLSTARIY